MEVRCQNPKCGKLIAQRLEGVLSFRCPRCGLDQTAVLDKVVGKEVQVA